MYKRQPKSRTTILFQNGPINEVGVNGLTHEALLAILCDRMRGFQAGPYHSADNAEALACMEQAQTALQRRTKPAWRAASKARTAFNATRPAPRVLVPANDKIMNKTISTRKS